MKRPHKKLQPVLRSHAPRHYPLHHSRPAFSQLLFSSAFFFAASPPALPQNHILRNKRPFFARNHLFICRKAESFSVALVQFFAAARRRDYRRSCPRRGVDAEETFDQT